MHFNKRKDFGKNHFKRWASNIYISRAPHSCGSWFQIVDMEAERLIAGAFLYFSANQCSSSFYPDSMYFSYAGWRKLLKSTVIEFRLNSSLHWEMERENHVSCLTETSCDGTLKLVLGRRLCHLLDILILWLPFLEVRLRDIVIPIRGDKGTHLVDMNSQALAGISCQNRFLISRILYVPNLW